MNSSLDSSLGGRRSIPALRTALRWGVVLGVLLCAWTLVVHALGFYTTDLASGQRADRLVVVLPILCVALALRTHARAGGALSFRDTLGVSVGVNAVSALLAVPFLWIYHRYVNPSWLVHLLAFERRRMAAAGAAPDEIERALAAIERSGGDVAQLTAGVFGPLILGLVIGLVAFLVVRGARALRGSGP